jgi:hypothetical protein
LVRGKPIKLTPEAAVRQPFRLLARQPDVHARLRRGWPDAEIVQQTVGQLPWGHNLVLLSKLTVE